MSEASALKTNTGRVLGKTKRKRKQNYFLKSSKGKFAGKTKKGSSKFFQASISVFLFSLMLILHGSQSAYPRKWSACFLVILIIGGYHDLASQILFLMNFTFIIYIAESYCKLDQFLQSQNGGLEIGKHAQVHILRNHIRVG